MHSTPVYQLCHLSEIVLSSFLDLTSVTCLLLLLHRKFVDDFHKLGLPLHVLVNNAGVHLKVTDSALCQQTSIMVSTHKPGRTLALWHAP
jgi:hypothetical protein